MGWKNKIKKCKRDLSFGYYGPDWDKKIQSMDNPNFWKYGVADLVFLDSMKSKNMVLDVGCGTGGLTLFLAERAQLIYIVGIDPVRSMIEVARQHAFRRSLNDRMDFVVCDGRQLPFKHFCFDALVSRGDAFVFMVPQKAALLEFKRVLEGGAVLVVEMDNVQWMPGKIISRGFEKMQDGAVAYVVEHFDVKRDHFKVFYVLSPRSLFVKGIRRKDEFIQSGKVEQRIPLGAIRKEATETRRGVVTHWPTVDEIKKLFNESGFENVEVVGDGLLMSLLLDGDKRVIDVMKKQPRLFFEIEKKLVQFVDPEKAPTFILRVMVP